MPITIASDAHLPTDVGRDLDRAVALARESGCETVTVFDGRQPASGTAWLMLRIGLGVDAHAFADGVPLVLGGVRFDHPRGLAGHSDGDVVAHALTDAVLGAAGLGDIGSLFPSGAGTPAGRSTRSSCSRRPTGRCRTRVTSS